MWFQLGFLLGMPTSVGILYAFHRLMEWYSYLQAVRSGEEQERLAAEWRRTHPDGPYTPATNEPQPQLIITELCPSGYGAAQILGYHNLGGQKTPSLYPGGKEKWLTEN